MELVVHLSGVLQITTIILRKNNQTQSSLELNIVSSTLQFLHATISGSAILTLFHEPGALSIRIL
jgi:hypothetical protein